MKKTTNKSNIVLSTMESLVNNNANKAIVEKYKPLIQEKMNRCDNCISVDFLDEIVDRVEKEEK